MTTQSNIRRIKIDDKSIVFDFAACDQFHTDVKPNGPSMFEDICTDKIPSIIEPRSGNTGTISVVSCTDKPTSEGCLGCYTSYQGDCLVDCKYNSKNECKPCVKKPNGTCISI